MLSDESVSATPTRNALYFSLIIHVSAYIALTWFSMTLTPPVTLKLTAVFAGTPEPVREPQPIYVPMRRTPRTLSDAPADLAQPSHHNAVTSNTQQNDEGGPAEYIPTEIPADLVATLDTDTVPNPGSGTTLTRTRTVPLIPSDDKPIVPPPPEPPPGAPDVQPPPAIGGHVEQAVLIEQTKPTYPALARSARVEGIVVLEATITEQGKLENIQLVSGHPMLVDAAIKAVQKWKYRPAKLNGKIISCPARIEVRFLLRYPGN